MAKAKDIPVCFLRECFDVDKVTGDLVWRERPKSHFPTLGHWKTWNTRFAGRLAGCINDALGYRVFNLRFEGKPRVLYAHRVIFAIVHGHWPTRNIDHKNRDRSDNKPENLRDVSQAENLWNTGKPRNNKSGFVGASWFEARGKWQSCISVHGKHIYLGYFDTAEAAHEAYLQAKKRLHSQQ